MKVIKPQKVGVLSRTFTFQRRHLFVISPVVGFRLGSRRSLVAEVDLWKGLTPHLAGARALDESMPKARGEFLLFGNAVPLRREAAAAMMVSAMLGQHEKRLRVTGDRFWLPDGTVSKPTPFAEMPVDWAHAFGGPAVPENPLGKGIARVETSAGRLVPLPNVEALGATVEAPGDRPAPASFSGFDFAWPQRQSKIGTYDAQWLREHFPGLAADIDWSAFNVAPYDQRIDGVWQGEEPYRLEGFHAEHAVIEGHLPGVQARAFVTQRRPDGAVFEEVLLRLDTVQFYPNEALGLMVFRGLYPVAEDDAHDLEHLVIACDDLHGARPLEHYRGVLDRRLDRRRGAIEALRDADLMPTSMRERALGESDEMRATAAMMKREKRLTEGLLRKAEAERRRAEGDMARYGIAMPESARAFETSLDPDDASLEPDAIAEALDQADAMLQSAREDADRATREALDSFREHCTAQGLDAAEILAKSEAAQGGPPRFSAAAQIASMREDALRDPSPGARERLDAALSEKNVEGLYQTETMLREMYRRMAHEQQAPAAPMPDALAARRAWVEGEHLAGRSLARADLTGVNLSGLDLTGADLREAWLEGARLDGAVCDWADLRGAVLTRADLTGARLHGARLQGANLGLATLVRCDLREADLSDAILVKAQVYNADFTRATVCRADLRGVEAEGAAFDEIDASHSLWLNATFEGVSFNKATLLKTLFFECTLRRCSFEGAELESAVMLQCDASEGRFRNAMMKGFRAVHATVIERGDFCDALLDGANLRDARLAGSVFHRVSMAGADFSGADLQGASLYRARGREARFVRANLSNAHMVSFESLSGLLTHALVEGADLQGANLFRADLYGVRGRPKSLEGANLTEVRYVARTEA